MLPVHTKWSRAISIRAKNNLAASKKLPRCPAVSKDSPIRVQFRVAALDGGGRSQECACRHDRRGGSRGTRPPRIAGQKPKATPRYRMRTDECSASNIELSIYHAITSEYIDINCDNIFGMSRYYIVSYKMRYITSYDTILRVYTCMHRR